MKTEPAHACSCAAFPDPLTALNRADAVFSGKVLHLKEEKIDSGDTKWKALMEIDRTWKGINQSQAWVYTNYGGSAACGMDFTEGETYLIYAHITEGNRIETSICSRSADLTQAGDDLRELGSGKVPKRVVDLVKEEAALSGLDMRLIGLASLLIVLMGGAAVLVYWKVKRKN